MPFRYPVMQSSPHCMDAFAAPAHYAPVHVLPPIKRLDDCFGHFLVRVICECGACREIDPEALACLVDWKVTLRELALRMRCSRCGRKAAGGARRSRDLPGDPSLRSE